jgi:hypothetical protein
MSQPDEADYSTRQIEASGYAPYEICLRVRIDHFRERDAIGPKHLGTDSGGQYAFVKLGDERITDHREGELPETEGAPVAYIGDNLGKYYYRSKDHESVPVDVLEWLQERGYSLVTGVDGGWKHWDGRPEWSENYIDFSEVEAVDMDSIIAERRDDE